MKNLMMSIIVCLGVIMTGIAFAGPVEFHGCSEKYPDLCATNVSEEPVHLFVTLEYLGCKGEKIVQTGAQYKMIEGKDYTPEKINASYVWKISHYDHFYMLPGQTVLVHNAPCYDGLVNYGTLERVFTFTPEKWTNFKAMVHAVNPFCNWAKPEEKK
jgi:hypothetical protein